MIPAVLIDGEKFDLIQELSLISEKVSQMVKLLKDDYTINIDVWCKVKGIENLLDVISLLL